MPVLKISAAAIGCLMILACQRPPGEAVHPTGGDADRGRDLIRAYGCHTCHTVPGVRGADALVGPPLLHIGSRVYVAGHLPNTPDNLMRWIRHPQEVRPDTAMPDLGVTEEDVRDIAAYLYTLR